MLARIYKSNANPDPKRPQCLPSCLMTSFPKKHVKVLVMMILQMVDRPIDAATNAIPMNFKVFLLLFSLSCSLASR